MNVVVESVEEIEPTPSGKRRVVISHVPEEEPGRHLEIFPEEGAER